MKKTLYVLLLVCLTVVLMIGASFPAHAATSGQVGNCQWTLNGTVLSINGNGALKVNYENAPWGKSITEVRINEGVTSISPSAFADCKTLYKVTLPSSLRVIDYGAFSNCTALTSVTIAEGLTTIGNYAFSNCSALIDITIPKTVTHIGFEVFQECYSLNNIFVDSSNPSFTSVDGVLFSKDQSVLVRYPCNKSGQTYTVPTDVKEIGSGAFESAWNLWDITLHDGITKIGFNAFFSTAPYNNSSKVYDGCFYLGNHLIDVKNTGMTSCTVRDGTKTIADGAFTLCDKLQQVILPEGLVSIGDSAFSWCKSLKSIYIPKSVTKIEDSAFYDCNAIKKVFYSGSTSERSKITVGIQNEKLTAASWKYNSCYGGKDHDFKFEVIIQNATCTKAGEKELTCSVCTVVVTEKIEATGHQYGPWSQTKAPTCVSTGASERSCTVCHDMESITVSVLGHVFGPWIVEIEASCNDVGVEKRTCALCQSLEAQNIEPKGHNYQKWCVDTNPTCTEDGLEKKICSNCDSFEARELPALGHSYGEFEMVKEPTCTENGLEKKFCSNCDSFEARDLPALEHSYGEFEMVKKPTFSKMGLENAVCEKCGDVKTAPLDKIDPTGYIICASIVASVAVFSGVIVYIITKKKRAALPKA